VRRIHGIVWLALFFLVRLPAPAAGVKPPFAHEPLGVANGCFVESVCLYDHFQEIHGPDAWVRVLQWGAKEDEQVVAGHAVAVFELEGRLWAWDINFGFRPLEVPPESREDVGRVAAPVLARYPGIVPLYPIYRYDFSQPPEEHPPEVLATHEVPAFRDATRAGARLAAHRPVNVVQFSYVRDGQTLQSAAAVFIFNGRVCIYFPERGTIPFIMEYLSILNLRQLQQAVHREYPGAFALKSLNY
jgi:hypothetical protein